MGVDNHVRHDALNGEGEVFLSVGHSYSALLSMSGCELIADLGDLDGPHLDLDKLLLLLISGKDNLVNVSLLTMLERH